MTGLSALVVASFLTVTAIPAWLMINLGGAALIVLGGWSAPIRKAVDGIDSSRLGEWARNVEPDLIEPPVVRRRSYGSDVAADPSNWNNTNDPLLAAQLESTVELRRYNDLLEAQQRAGTAVAPPHVRDPHQPPGRSRRWVWAVFSPLLLVAAGLVGGALMLSVAASWNADAVPPTSGELQTGIHRRTTERQAHIVAEFQERFPAESGVGS